MHRAIHAASGGRHLLETLTHLGNFSTRMWVVLGDRLDVAGHTGERAASIARHHVQSFEAMVRAAL